jgi:ribosomal protein S18 acetylase RimI-like enzyme
MIAAKEMDESAIRRHRWGLRAKSPWKWNAFGGIPLPVFIFLAVLLPALIKENSKNCYGFGFCAGFVFPTKTLLRTSRTERANPSDCRAAIADNVCRNSYVHTGILHLWPASLTTLSPDTQTSSKNRNGFETSSSEEIREPRVKFNSRQDDYIPFVVERVPIRPPLKLYKEIAQMCINAFFNTDNSKTYNAATKHSSSPPERTPFYKEWQLHYLRTLQAGDLERRRRREPLKNIMFIARRVVPLSLFNNDVLRQPLLKQNPLVLDTNRIQNRPFNDNDEEYVYGELIGFVEVTQRPYALGEEGRKSVERRVLTNLSVCRSTRQSGVGSALVDACERVAAREFCGQRGDSSLFGGAAVVPEIVLEVEEDNLNAIQFYRKRGYVDVCTDPTSRRYDTSGLWLQQVRCKRLVMKKDLRRPFLMPSNNAAVTNMENTVNLGLQALQRFRNNLLNVS